MEIISEMTDKSKVVMSEYEPLQSDIYIRNTSSGNPKYSYNIKYDGSE